MTVETQAMEQNLTVYERDVSVYRRLELLPPEQAVLKRFRRHWHEMDMLDIGVGAGRTSYTYSAVARTYVGIDYSARMLDSARASIGEDEAVSFFVCDARDMSRFPDGSFDFVLFSFNGIDSVNAADRLSVLSEVRRLLTDGGHFYFSSHSLKGVPFPYVFPEVDFRQPTRTLYRIARDLKTNVRRLRLNRGIDRRALEQRGWGLLRDEAHGGELLQVYVMPDFQVRQLEDAGFSVVEVYDASGKSISVEQAGSDPWLHYLCR